jgi:DNA-binding transcriptional regulator YhcF (GntR family)
MKIEDSIRRKTGNRLLAAMPTAVWEDLKPNLELVELVPGHVLCTSGKPLTEVHFPLTGTIVAVLVRLRDGPAVEATIIGREGVVGGIVTGPSHPSFARAIAQVPGWSARIAATRLQETKDRSAEMRDLFARYADALLAQVLQSVVCNAFHPMQQRLARRLLSIQDRIGTHELPLTQDYLAQTLGVHRSTVIRVARSLQEHGMIEYTRGRIAILDGSKLEKAACECNGAIARHFERVLPQTAEQRSDHMKGAIGRKQRPKN